MDDRYSLRDRQSQTSSAGLMLASFRNPVERLKNTPEGLLWHAIAVVRDENSRRVRAPSDESQ
jgi:hypothetical protein